MMQRKQLMLLDNAPGEELVMVVNFVRLVVVVMFLGFAATAAATPEPYKQAKQACVTLGGYFASEPDHYYCNFGGSPPPHADKHWYGPTYVKICARYGGTIYEEYPPPYSYDCTIPTA